MASGYRFGGKSPLPEIPTMSTINVLLDLSQKEHEWTTKELLMAVIWLVQEALRTRSLEPFAKIGDFQYLEGSLRILVTKDLLDWNQVNNTEQNLAFLTFYVNMDSVNPSFHFYTRESFEDFI